MTAEDITRLLPDLVEKISKSYPDVKGASSSVEEKQSGISLEALRKLNIPRVRPAKQFIVTFQKQIAAEDGTPLHKVVRATLNDSGELIRVTESKTLSVKRQIADSDEGRH